VYLVESLQFESHVKFFIIRCCYSFTPKFYSEILLVHFTRKLLPASPTPLLDYDPSTCILSVSSPVDHTK
jgi:hypothetical protein